MTPKAKEKCAVLGSGMCGEFSHDRKFVKGSGYRTAHGSSNLKSYLTTSCSVKAMPRGE